MAATCAACMQPIVSRAQLVVMDTEVLHKQCVGQITELWRSRKAVAEALPAVVAANKKIARATAEYEALEGRLAVMQRRAVAAEQKLGDVESMRDALTEHNRELRRDMAALRAEIESRAAPVPVAPPIAPEPAVRDQDLESAAARFAMLDLD